jgi:hypothetical protein
MFPGRAATTKAHAWRVYTRDMRAFLIGVGLLMAAALPLQATTYLPASFNEIVAESSTIVYGRVSSVRAAWSDDRRLIDSYVTVQALDYLKGSRGATTLFRVPGGQVGDRVMVIPGVPSFREGDMVVLFLKGAGPAIPHPVGLAQGVFRVVADPDGAPVVLPAPMVARGAPARVQRGDPARGPIPLAAFAAEVRGLMEQVR